MAAADDDGDEEEDSDNPQPGSSSDSPKKERGFVASKGWFEKFQETFSLWSVSQYGETASADTAAAQRYVVEKFPQIIEESGYLLEQLFNTNETGLFWKRMPPARSSSRMR